MMIIKRKMLDSFPLTAENCCNEINTFIFFILDWPVLTHSILRLSGITTSIFSQYCVLLWRHSAGGWSHCWIAMTRWLPNFLNLPHFRRDWAAKQRFFSSVWGRKHLIVEPKHIMKGLFLLSKVLLSPFFWLAYCFWQNKLYLSSI